MTTTQPRTQPEYIVLTDDDYRVLGQADFGAEGLQAIESIGPFVDIQASGPLLMVHDARIEPHLGLGHHPHRANERLFYIMQGELDHDDSRNDIQGHVNEGDVALFTEGVTGMMHSEWNNGDKPTLAYILVYTTDPVPPQAALTVLRAADIVERDEAPGIRTKEIVGGTSQLEVNGDLRYFADSAMAAGTSLDVTLADGEGALISVRDGGVTFDGRAIGAGATVVFPPAPAQRTATLEATNGARVLRTVHGPGLGFVRRSSHR